MKRLLFFIVFFSLMFSLVKADNGLRIQYNGSDLVLSEPVIIRYSSSFDRVLASPGVNVMVDSVAITKNFHGLYKTMEIQRTFLAYDPETSTINMVRSLDLCEKINLNLIFFGLTVFFIVVAGVMANYEGPFYVYSGLLALFCLLFAFLL